ncbi:MAG: threonine synthase [Proteobacteria bacterium]|nr:threonine synthase [Pseudomonadota bacterium]MCL2308544.1 threonine synthase [Pseudomonadota bacterium]
MLICEHCAVSYTTETPRWRCDCGGTLRLEFSARFDLAVLRERTPSMLPGLWRYAEALPVPVADAISLGEGLTPLLPLAGPWGNAHFKLDFMMPTGSFKDRGSALMISQLKRWGVTEIIEDSSGNAGASIAAYCARAGIKAHVFVPAQTSAGKAMQIALYGARLAKIAGTREDTSAAALDAAQNIFYASHNRSPYFIHGVKTLAFELWEQLGFRAPDAVIVPAGNGSLVLGCHIGFSELRNADMIARLPRIIAVQAARCAPLARAWQQWMNDPVPVNKGDTIAEGIATAVPIRGRAVLAAVRETNGLFVTVEEHEILERLKAVALAGLYIEPTSAVALAALTKLRAQGELGADDTVVVELTGSGLKATDKLVKVF